MEYFILFAAIRVQLGSMSAACFKELFTHIWPKICKSPLTKNVQISLTNAKSKRKWHEIICVEEPGKCRQW